MQCFPVPPDNSAKISSPSILTYTSKRVIQSPLRLYCGKTVELIELAFCRAITEKVVDEISGCLPWLMRVYSAVNIPFMRSTIFKAFSRHARSSSARLLIDGRSCPDIAHYLARNYGRQTVKKIKKFFGTNTNRPTVTLDWFGFS